MNRDLKIYIAIVIIVVVIIVGIYYFKSSDQESVTEELMRCIAGKAILYSQTGCGHCITQKEILGNYSSLFMEINCLTDRDKCVEAGITGTPTWIINKEKFEGSRSIEELKQLTGC